MWNLIRAFWRWCSQQQRCINRLPQINSSLNVATQICDDDMIVKNEWSVRNVVNRNYHSHFAGARIGVVCHGGSYRFWELDSKKGCFVPLVLK
jgi:hypothetical protein